MLDQNSRKTAENGNSAQGNGKKRQRFWRRFLGLRPTLDPPADHVSERQEGSSFDRSTKARQKIGLTESLLLAKDASVHTSTRLTAKRRESGWKRQSQEEDPSGPAGHAQASNADHLEEPLACTCLTRSSPCLPDTRCHDAVLQLPLRRRHPAIRDDEDFVRLGEVVRVLERIVANECFHPRNGGWECANCPYGKACRGWR
jgi:hypothetical protein